MKKIVFTEEFCQPGNLFPFTLTRRVQDVRVGILTIRQKWELYLGMDSYDHIEGDYKDGERSVVIDETIGEDIIYLVHGNILPTNALIKRVNKLKTGECISLPKLESIVYCISRNEIVDLHKITIRKAISFNEPVAEIKFPWDINKLNGAAIEEDVRLLRKSRKYQEASETNKLINQENIFIEKGAQVEHCFLNAKEGPIYIEKNALVMEGSMLRGPISIGPNATVKMGAKIYGATTIGPGCIAGGEIKNSVFFGHSNKAHDGYIGDSVIGEWCNMGAGTSNSNIKNTASEIMIWTPNGLKKAGLKCGVLVGDYTRMAINTSINTGTVIGVCCNIIGSGLTPKYIPSFSWGSDGIQRYDFEKSIKDIQNWKELKHEIVTDREKTILKHIFDQY
jgi:UDP-N-acetylglucosamine diphosphorylase/glucosamine-1-phosphate N-acetyltransferase